MKFTEFGVFLNEKRFSPRPPRLDGAISELRFTRKPEAPHFLAFLPDGSIRTKNLRGQIVLWASTLFRLDAPQVLRSAKKRSHLSLPDEKLPQQSLPLRKFCLDLIY